jgi:hypothetical protein
MSESSQPHHSASPPGSHYQPALSVVLIIVVLFVAAAFLMLRYVNPASSPSATTLPPSETTTTIHHHTVAKSTVRVQVANGTTVSNLARSYSQELLTQGWNTLPGVNAHKAASTIVYFNPGFKWAAIQIADKIHVGLHSIQALNGQRPVPGASSDDVIVILGHNSASKG